MKQGKSARSDALRWKRKFLDSLEDQERSEAEFQSRIDLLRRGLVGVSLAGDGLDTGLDEELSSLRSTLRSEDSEKGLNALLGKIEKSVLRLDSRKEQSSWALERAISLNITQLQSVEISREIKRKIKKFSRALPKNIKESQGHTELISDFLDLLRMVVRELRQDPEEDLETAGFWQKLFGKESNSPSSPVSESHSEPLLEKTESQETPSHDFTGSPEEGDQDPHDTSYDDLLAEDSEILDLDLSTEVAEAVPEEVTDEENSIINLADEVNVLDEVDGHIELDGEEYSGREADDIAGGEEEVAGSGKSTEPGFSSIAIHVEALLLRIIDNIWIAEQSTSLANSIKETVDRGLNWYEFVSVLEDISTVILASFGEERSGFQEFLNDVNDSLEQVQEFVQRSKGHSQAAKESDKKLDQDVREQVSGMENSVQGADDLDELKVTVQDHLAHILSSMDKFKADKGQQEASVAMELRHLVQRMDSMEKESRQVRLHLEQQQQQAMKDVLTELPNRAAYDKCVNDEFQNWQVRKENLCLVMADVDHFKNINDTYGHLAGDKVLKIIAGQIASRIRKSDFVARYGGEEFVIIMSGTTLEDASVVIDKVRRAIEKCPFHFQKQQVQVTMSFGIASFEEHDSIESVFVLADKALYRAKESGRNKYCVVDRSISEEE